MFSPVRNEDPHCRNKQRPGFFVDFLEVSGGIRENCSCNFGRYAQYLAPYVRYHAEPEIGVEITCMHERRRLNVVEASTAHQNRQRQPYAFRYV